MKNKLHLIANYLPQFHPTKENNEWWGEGFTEWTNVSRARSLFKNHKQPHLPSSLGFYDLRYSEIKNKQAELAQEAGVSAFCYWHYWFGNGKRLLNIPFDQVVSTGKPNFPFCLGWANHDWESKDWNPNASAFIKKKLVIQEYGGIDDYKMHFYDMLPAFKDERYYKINGKLVFMIFRPDSIPDAELFISTWRYLAKENGIDDFYFIARTVDKNLRDIYLNQGYDLVNLCMLLYPFDIKFRTFNIIKRMVKAKLFNKVNVVEYSNAIKVFDDKVNYDDKIAPTIIPNWDHTPRSGVFGTVLNGSNPALFKKHVNNMLKAVKHKEDKIIFLKSWNEWGEGNYIEPDIEWGKKYLETLSNCIRDIKLL